MVIRYKTPTNQTSSGSHGPRPTCKNFSEEGRGIGIQFVAWKDFFVIFKNGNIMVGFPMVFLKNGKNGNHPCLFCPWLVYNKCRFIVFCFDFSIFLGNHPIRGWNRNKNEKGHGNASSRILMPIKFREELPAATEFRAHIKESLKRIMYWKQAYISIQSCVRMCDITCPKYVYHIILYHIIRN